MKKCRGACQTNAQTGLHECSKVCEGEKPVPVEALPLSVLSDAKLLKVADELSKADPLCYFEPGCTIVDNFEKILDPFRGRDLQTSELTGLAMQIEHGGNKALPDVFEKLDELGLKHPLDWRKFPNAIVNRIYELKAQTEELTGKQSHDASYCDAFVPKFYELGLKTFEEGGICFGYNGRQNKTMSDILNEPEMTAAEAFEACNKTIPNYGSCSEATYKIASAFAMAAPQCNIEIVLTQNHVFPRYKNLDLDPSEVGRAYWEKKISAFDLYQRHFGEEEELTADEALWPDFFAHTEIQYQLYGSSLNLFKGISKQAKKRLPTEKLVPFGVAIIENWPNDAYSHIPLSNFIKNESDARSAAKALEERLPNSGFAELVWAIWLRRTPAPEKSVEYARKALSFPGAERRHALAFKMLASSEMDKGNFSEAEKLLERAKTIAPQLSWTHVLSGRLHYRKGQFDEALKDAAEEKRVHIFNSAPAERLELEVLLAQYRTRDILKQKRSKQNADIRIWALINEGKLKEAKRLIPHLKNKVYLEAWLALYSLDIRAAKALVSKLPKGSARNGIEYSIALSENNRKKVEELRSEMKKNYGEDKAAFYALMGEESYLNGDFASARSNFKLNAEHSNIDLKYRSEDISMDIDEGKTLDARIKIFLLSRKYPSLSSADSLTAWRYLREERYDDVLKLLESNEKRGVGFPSEDIPLKGFALYGAKKYGASMKVAKTLIKKLPKNHTGRLLAARIYHKLGKIDKARSLAKQARALMLHEQKYWKLFDPNDLLKELETKK